MKKPETNKKPRSDKGTIQITPRDIYSLTWIAHQYAARFDQIRDLFTAYDLRTELLAVSTVHEKIAKWRKAGWVSFSRWLANEPGWVWMTKAGLEMLDLDNFLAKPPSVTRLAHIYAINEVKLVINWKTWLSERSMRAGLKKGDTSVIPDAIINGQTAIEVEITPKKPDDLERKMRRLLSAWPIRFDDAVFYVPNNSMFKATTTARSKLLPEQRQKIDIQLVELEHMPGLE